ncbi:hypothetical protein SETIT_4G035300v2 [Setaria italica]|uniref:Uncharacterized protein n=1 Tax=Setaria italica TaxID=4555 RepID=K3Y342_SETIT|nr:uncharacterized protein LOC106804298 isoform X1 [Setaria italica]RCV20177.1 hypothetical protein SETIT_4G035300v2 [Setaria italica]RCV20178.1 hypothetical protein SETIT_4G035300v2 [Setaria italica]RCV20179.1 hypothetical protein SETIT_4G035300v2 [Setaria italica]RCV20180.1 hypothetical protein SETIT_4G035300v2 [Setaria italica]RCV20181.1 hypothetical protein SETIT_4G035300v2 [Setaria italica]
MDNRREEGPADARGLVRAGVVLLTVTCAAAAYRSAAAGDVGSVAFVIVTYGALLLLLRFLRAYELVMAAPEAAADDRVRLIRRKVWALCTLLTAMFAWKVAGVVPWPVAIGVWAAAAATSAGGFVLMFR